MEQTIIKPTPGGRPNLKQPDVKPVDSTVVISKSPEIVNNDSVVAFGLNPILAEANGILSMVGQIRSTASHSDVLFLKETLAQKLRDYENRLRQHNVELETIDTARYCLCCSIDEAVLNTHWGSQSTWSHDSLLSSFYSSSQGGEAFFKHLDNALSQPESQLDLLELMYVCLSLGFVGQYRLEKNGLENHRRLRKQIMSILKSYGRGTAKEMSANIDKRTLTGSQMSERAPLWVVCSVTSAILVCVFMYLSYDLNSASNRTFSNLVNLIQPDRQVSSAELESKVQPVADRISMYLATEMNKGLVTVEALPDRVRISLKAQDLFESGSADVVAYIQPVVSKIARTLEATEGKILVTGHTDDNPIFTSKYPSNWHLSLARATAMSDQLIANSGLEGRVLPEGLGDARPLVENTSSDNRALNRRIEIDLIVAN
ncbi:MULTISPECIES: type VI secretion system protein TssL, long form [Vibrio]|jgi:type VI secretion system protein ImpK|uniref:Type VI secretion system protein TssL, long form n=1 Tax=Vibrio jasicida TaxID=766224 RepID=A0ABW7JB32_9VIBR|nr:MULTISPECIES: type VI secretion system protein TssL, long form [Vibrio]KIP66246.1 flagellar motor protein [Vibrio harveyi]PAW07958.1 type VI secretion system protein TssL [Vibrio sp. V1B]PMO47474.1 flagellar motor protein [Vibrio sp. 10N.222.52.B12]UQA54070.1 type VI secretion system protein TssL, long form [Vibrio sp. ED002]